MEGFKDILLEVWREACRHIEIEEAADTLAALLARRLPLSSVIIRRLDFQRSLIETVAVGPSSKQIHTEGLRTNCAEQELTKLARWCEKGKAASIQPSVAGNAWLANFMPRGLEVSDALLGPLCGADGPAGLVVFTLENGNFFSPKHLEMTEALLEPFSVALENDQRLRELTALRKAAEAKNRSLLDRLGRKDIADALVGAESGLRSVMERVKMVGDSDAPVLILGETGTGKELIAREIHRGSGRASSPFIRVNCGAIPPELVDSQLFGHERGAFTGAVSARKGWFEQADGGTLFLDEIGELPPAAQVRLLRVLQDGWFERVGGHRSVHVNVRIVAATHRDLAKMVCEGRFREDLWYRIAVFPLILPSLRERKNDIQALAEHFAERASNRFHLPLALPTDEDIKLLKEYSWPGNVRELATVIDRATILGKGKRLDIKTALGAPMGSRDSVRGAKLEAMENSAAVKPRTATLDDAMREHIKGVLAETRGKIEGPNGAAALLNINPHTLRARMRKLSVDWRRFRQ